MFTARRCRPRRARARRRATKTALTRLARDVDNAQRSYDAVQARLTQSSLESQANQTNIYPLTVAQPPLEPSAPRTSLNALLAVFGGTLAAVLVALGLELLNRRVRTVSDIGATLGLPVMGVLADGNRRVKRKNHLGVLTRERAAPRLSNTNPKAA